MSDYKHWHLETDDEGIAWLWADQPSSTNVLSQAVLAELEQLLTGIDQERPRGLVLASAKSGGFIAGADVKAFTQVSDEEASLSLIRQGQGVMDRLANLPLPTVALLHGYCLGGGLELALACDYRVAEAGTKTRLGLPEVKLGIHPGFGGTVRLPALIGVPSAMDLMLSGRTVDARAAKRMGLVDHAVPERQLRRAARALISEAPGRHRPAWWLRAVNTAPIRHLLAPRLRRQVAAKARPDLYPAPYALIDLWRRHGGDPVAMEQAEARSVAHLLNGDTAQNLVRVFFLQERLKSLGRQSQGSRQRLHVVGGGAMGGDIAAWCAMQGLLVTVQDRSPDKLAEVVKRADRLYHKKLKDPKLVRAALDRLQPDPDGIGVPKADVVIEAIFEDVAAKQGLYRDLEPRLKPEALLATNTSSIPLETLGEAFDQPERLIGLHFFNPVAQMQLVEVVQGANTDAHIAQEGAAFVRQIDRLPLPVSSSPGFLVNRVLMPYLLEAVTLVQEGVPPEAVDQAALDFGMPMGPIALADAVGLDICLSVAEILGEALHMRVPGRLKELVTAGRLGQKSGEGFYRYHKGEAQKTALPKDYQAPADLTDRLILRLLNEAMACLREGVVADADLVDAGMVFGTGFAPFRGGPMHYLNQHGQAAMKARLAELERAHGERFQADPVWAHEP